MPALGVPDKIICDVPALKVKLVLVIIDNALLLFPGMVTVDAFKFTVRAFEPLALKIPALTE